LTGTCPDGTALRLRVITSVLDEHDEVAIDIRPSPRRGFRRVASGLLVDRSDDVADALMAERLAGFNVAVVTAMLRIWRVIALHADLEVLGGAHEAVPRTGWNSLPVRRPGGNPSGPGADRAPHHGTGNRVRHRHSRY
jgi:hypothetical protein